MTYSEDDIRARGQAIAALCLEIHDNDAAEDALGGYLMTQQAHRNPQMYFFAAEDFLRAGRPALFVAAWRLFAACLEDYAHEYREDAEIYAQVVLALSAFVDMIGNDVETFSPYGVFSEKINAAIDYFDEVTLGERPAERFRNDMLLMGDKSVEGGDLYAAANYYKKAAAEQHKAEGWLRLLQVMAEVDLGQGYGIAAAEDACRHATDAGIWYASPYYLQRLISTTEEDAEIISGDMREDMSRHTRQFIRSLHDYAAPTGQAKGFSKYLAPVMRQDSVVGIFAQPKPEDVLARLEAAGQASAIKSAVGAFLPVVIYMLQQGWIVPEDISQLPDALSRFEDLLSEESATIAQTSAQSSSVTKGSFDAEQKVFHDMAMGLNASITAVIAETRQFLQEKL